jgi:hypothetical protein
MKRLLTLFALLAVICGFGIVPAFAGDDEATAIDSTAGLKKGAKGVARADGEKEFLFTSKDGNLNIPYEQVTRLEYGMKSHMTMGYSVLTGIHPKKAKDYLLTIEYNDTDQKPQSVMFKLGKDKIWTTLLNLQTKSGKKIEFGDEKARKEAMKDAPPGQVL